MDYKDREGKIADVINRDIEISVMEAMMKMNDGKKVTEPEPYIQDYMVDKKGNIVELAEPFVRDDMFILPLNVVYGHDKNSKPLTRETMVLIDNEGEIISLAVESRDGDFVTEYEGQDSNGMDYDLVGKFRSLQDTSKREHIGMGSSFNKVMSEDLQLGEDVRYKDAKEYAKVICEAAYLNKVAFTDRLTDNDNDKYLADEMVKMKNIDSVIDYIYTMDEYLDSYNDLTTQMEDTGLYEIEKDEEDYDYDDEL